MEHKQQKYKYKQHRKCSNAHNVHTQMDLSANFDNNQILKLKVWKKVKK